MPKVIKPHPAIPSDPAAMQARIVELQTELDARRKTKRESMQRYRTKEKQKKFAYPEK